MLYRITLNHLLKARAHDRHSLPSLATIYYNICMQQYAYICFGIYLFCIEYRMRNS